MNSFGMVVPLKMLNQMVRMDPESDLYISREDISYISLTANMEEHRISYLTQCYHTYGIDGVDYDHSNRNMLEDMDAVVVVMSAQIFVPEFEREFIESNFARCCLKNVFFAIGLTYLRTKTFKQYMTWLAKYLRMCLQMQMAISMRTSISEESFL